MGIILTCLERRIAAYKVNAHLDPTAPKMEVAPDSEFASGQTRFEHSAWDGVMRRHVSKGEVQGITANVVDYKGVAADPAYEEYVAALAKADIASLRPNELLALYINAYNALCIGHILRYMKENDGKMPDSVNNTSPGKIEIWDAEAGIVGGTMVTLNEIEHRILRSRWAEPRIHASIVCASASCPNLRTEAFVPSKLNAQMDAQTSEWLADTTKGLKVEGSAAIASRIFLWFDGDFAAAGGPEAWMAPFAPEEAKRVLTFGKSLQFFPYNWSLNKKAE